MVLLHLNLNSKNHTYTYKRRQYINVIGTVGNRTMGPLYEHFTHLSVRQTIKMISIAHVIKNAKQVRLMPAKVTYRENESN